MRILNGILAAMLLLLAFIANGTPEGVVLVPLFGVGAFWTLLAAALPRWLALRPLVVVLSFTMSATILAAIYYWPGSGAAWRAEVMSGKVTEATALILVAAALLGPILTSIRMERLKKQERLQAREDSITARHRSAPSGERALDA